MKKSSSIWECVNLADRNSQIPKSATTWGLQEYDQMHKTRVDYWSGRIFWILL